jgi:hypothetical protein
MKVNLRALAVYRQLRFMRTGESGIHELMEWAHNNSSQPTRERARLKVAQGLIDDYGRANLDVVGEGHSRRSGVAALLSQLALSRRGRLILYADCLQFSDWRIAYRDITGAVPHQRVGSRPRLPRPIVFPRRASGRVARGLVAREGFGSR